MTVKARGLRARVMEAVLTGYNPKATALSYNFYYQCTEDGKWGTKNWNEFNKLWFMTDG